jgi:dTDP-4-dehydrorhamnose 3,5-epimerase-like enzyme
MVGPLARVRPIDIPTVGDDRGYLSVVEAQQTIPFPIRRVFYMHHLTAERGGHAHRDTDQLVVCVSGALRLDLTDGRERLSVRLDDPTKGLFIPAMVFIDIRDIAPATVCLVLASTHYDMGRSLRSYEAFLEAVGQP